MEFILVNESLKQEWMTYSNWSKQVNEEVIHISDGISIIAKVNNELCGIISVYTKSLLPPLQNTIEAYIDNIEIRTEYRHQGVATKLIHEIITKIKQDLPNVYQIRAWSSNDKVAMINLWKKLQFTLNPVTIYPNNQTVHGYYVSKVL